MAQFDVVIPVGPNDISVLHSQLEYTKKNIIGRRNIYIISTIFREDIQGVIFIPESIFPFSLQSVAEIHGASARNGWYLQQLLKFYTGFCIPGILPNYLVIDSDTFFLKPTSFIENDLILFNPATEYHIPYFLHMKRLHPSLVKDHNISAISHHMLFTTKYVKELIDMVEQYHSKVFWKVFLEQVDPTMRLGMYNSSGASEYEMYFNFMNNYHPEAFTIRKLHWAGTKTLELDKHYDYVSIHWYERM